LAQKRRARPKTVQIQAPQRGTNTNKMKWRNYVFVLKKVYRAMSALQNITNSRQTTGTRRRRADWVGGGFEKTIGKSCLSKFIDRAQLG